jgi:DNA-binding MarR family transcriptional regulator
MGVVLRPKVSGWLSVVTVGAGAPLSQHEAAELLGVDRTTMVALVDGLEDKGLAERHRSPQDRRKNIVSLTGAGQRCLDGAGAARDQAEQKFLAPLGRDGATRFVEALQILASRPPV